MDFTKEFCHLVKINGEMHTCVLLDVLSRHVLKESCGVTQERKECSQKDLVIHRK